MMRKHRHLPKGILATLVAAVVLVSHGQAAEDSSQQALDSAMIQQGEPGCIRAAARSHGTFSLWEVKTRAPPVIGSVTTLTVPPLSDMSTISAFSELPFVMK